MMEAMNRKRGWILYDLAEEQAYSPNSVYHLAEEQAYGYVEPTPSLRSK